VTTIVILMLHRICNIKYKKTSVICEIFL